MSADAIAAAQVDLEREGVALLPAGSDVIDCHTHLGVDEDGQSVDLPDLLGFLDAVGPMARRARSRSTIRSGAPATGCRTTASSRGRPRAAAA